MLLDRLWKRLSMRRLMRCKVTVQRCDVWTCTKSSFLQLPQNFQILDFSKRAKNVFSQTFEIEMRPFVFQGMENCDQTKRKESQDLKEEHQYYIILGINVPSCGRISLWRKEPRRTSYAMVRKSSINKRFLMRRGGKLTPMCLHFLLSQ